MGQHLYYCPHRRGCIHTIYGDFYGLLLVFYVYKHKWRFKDKFLKKYCVDFHTFAVYACYLPRLSNSCAHRYLTLVTLKKITWDFFINNVLWRHLKSCLFVAFVFIHQSHSPLCSFFTKTKSPKIQLKLSQLIILPLPKLRKL